ncbi:MAG: sugar ABC transporter permease, partial [Deltaproteobacteria bacterium]|nr:sugar ABC transporter permease [Deltaproteobacteria bacterium]
MKERGRIYVLPAIIILSLVTIYPLIYVFYLSLHRNMPIFGISKFVALKNYMFLLKDERFWNALKNTIYFTGISVMAELLLGLMIAIFLNRPFRGKGIV